MEWGALCNGVGTLCNGVGALCKEGGHVGGFRDFGIMLSHNFASRCTILHPFLSLMSVWFQKYNVIEILQMKWSELVPYS